jgi:hypothetical protein
MDWTPSVGYRVGDKVWGECPRSLWAIWWERITTLKWRVPTTEKRLFEAR